jgi:hypothetical protein
MISGRPKRTETTYFRSPDVQLRTSVIGFGANSAAGTLTRRRWPSRDTSDPWACGVVKKSFGADA